MRDKQVQKIIRSLADEKAPKASIDLWPAIRTQALASESKPRHARRSRLRLVGAALGLAVLLVGVVFILSPQGQAWAQEAFQFFNQTESDRVPVDSLYPTKSAAERATATPGNPLDNLMTFEEVQELAGFDLYQAIWLPEGFEFTGALYDEETQVVTLLYDRYGNMANRLALRQEPFDDLTDCNLCTSVGSSADVRKVSVNGVYGEYVEGVWQLVEEDGYWTDEAEWVDTPYRKRMIWQVDGTAFELSYTGFLSYIRKGDMVDIAEGMATSQNAFITKDLTFEEVQEISGKQLYQPTWQPEDLKFREAIYDAETGIVTLIYAYQGNFNNPIRLIIESARDSEACDLCRVIGSSVSAQNISINGIEGEYVEGVWTLQDGEAVWKYYSDNLVMQHLIWQTDETIFDVSYRGAHLTKADLIAIAESIR